ncbi:LuxR C-terminal-related transcriptional regulator [Streptomyces sp. NPDC058653]|uniref:response regulator transcription factor n=1 Tax=Streptomyces sp. NPDC058653 TaxID=3346576 RepID=UPI003649DF04
MAVGVTHGSRPPEGAAAALLIPLRRALPDLAVPVAGGLLGAAVLTVVVPVLAYGAVRSLTAADRRSRFRTPPVLVAVAVCLSLAVTMVGLPSPEYVTMPFTLLYPAGMSLLLLVVPAMLGTMAGQRRLLVRNLREPTMWPRGMANTEIAAQLGVSEGTGKATVRALLTRLGCDNRVQVAVLAQRAGLVSESSRLPALQRFALRWPTRGEWDLQPQVSEFTGRIARAPSSTGASPESQHSKGQGPAPEWSAPF